MGGPERNSKKTKQYTKPTIEEIDGQFFLIADEIYLLSEHPTKLCPDQVNELPFNIAWNGPRLSFKVDPKECYRLLFELISDMNAMQKNKKYLGFCIGTNFSLCNCLEYKFYDCSCFVVSHDGPVLHPYHQNPGQLLPSDEYFRARNINWKKPLDDSLHEYF